MSSLILYNGTIHTLDPARPHAQALGIANGRVVAVGSEGHVRAALPGAVTGINLHGRAAIPAITDAHVHLVWHALARRRVNLDGVSDFEAALELIAEAHRALPPGAWLEGRGWDQSLWGRWPTSADLDRVVPDRPVALSRRDGHAVWVNAAALRIAGIDDQTPDPPGGSIRREAGQAVGLLFEHAIELIRRHIPEATARDRQDAIEEAIAEAHSYGMIGMHVPTAMNDGDGRMALEDVQQLRQRGRLKLRCLLAIGPDALEHALEVGLRTGLGDRLIRMGPLKLFADGTLGSETAEMLTPYEGRVHTGMAVIPTETLNETIFRAMAGGIAVTVHAIGDAANRKVLDAYEAAQRRLGVANWMTSEYGPVLPIPNRIEHCQVVHPNDIPRFKELNVVASMQPVHCTSDLLVADQLWGPRCRTAYAWRAFQEAGVTLAFGSDAPVEPLDPWPGVQAAVTRRRIDGTPPGGWYPEQRLSLTETLTAFTYGSALAAGAADEQGMLKPGMLADVAVLNQDPFKIAPEALHTVRADMTLLEGEVVWER